MINNNRKRLRNALIFVAALAGYTYFYKYFIDVANLIHWGVISQP